MKPKSKKSKTFFKTSLLSALLVGGFAHAADTSSQSLPEVRVIGTAASTNISRNQMDKETTTDLKQALRNQVGVGMGSGNGVAQWTNIRGMGEDRINFDVDNTNTSINIFHHQSRFILDPQLAKSIRVEKGAGAASAGFGVVAGRIKATTVSAKDLLRDGKPYGFKIGSTYSSNKGHSVNGAAYASVNGFNALVAGNLLKNGNYKNGLGQRDYGSKLDQTGLLAKVGYDFNPDHSLSLSYREEKQKGLRSAQSEFSYTEANYNNPTNYFTNGLHPDTMQKQQTTNLEYSGKNMGFISKLDANVFHIKTTDHKPPKNRASNTDKSTVEESTADTTGANFNFSSNLLNDHTLKYGVNLRQEKSKPSYKGTWNGERDIVQEKKTEKGVYVEGIWHFAPITLTTGLRYDHFDYRVASNTKASKGSLNPSLGLIYEINPQLSLSANLSQSTRAPRLNEVLLANANYAAAKVDSNLKPEKVHHAEIGMNWQNQNLDLRASVFHTRIKDVITYGRNAITNDGKLQSTGYELDAIYRWNGLKARLGLSHSNPIAKDSKGAAVAESPQTYTKVGTAVVSELSYRMDNPNVEVGWRGHYARHADVIGRGGAIMRKTGYGVHDVFANWQPMNNDSLNVNFAVNNVFDKAYRSHSQRTNVGYYERGREFTVGVNYKF